MWLNTETSYWLEKDGNHCCDKWKPVSMYSKGHVSYFTPCPIFDIINGFWVITKNMQFYHMFYF
jgi:hypothetical protein